MHGVRSLLLRHTISASGRLGRLIKSLKHRWELQLKYSPMFLIREMKDSGLQWSFPGCFVNMYVITSYTLQGKNKDRHSLVVVIIEIRIRVRIEL